MMWCEQMRHEAAGAHLQVVNLPAVVDAPVPLQPLQALLQSFVLVHGHPIELLPHSCNLEVVCQGVSLCPANRQLLCNSDMSSVDNSLLVCCVCYSVVPWMCQDCQTRDCQKSCSKLCLRRIISRSQCRLVCQQAMMQCRAGLTVQQLQQRHLVSPAPPGCLPS